MQKKTAPKKPAAKAAAKPAQPKQATAAQTPTKATAASKLASQTPSAASSTASATQDNKALAPATPLAAPSLEAVSSNSISKAAIASQLADKAAALAKVTAGAVDGTTTEKPNVHMAVVGHVDSGKSTLVGHLLLKQGRFTQKDARKAEKASVEHGKPSFALAYLLDENEEERRRGVTVDVGSNWFETENLRVTVLDCPGHRDFVPNMVSGAVRADAALLVVSALPGEFEAGFLLEGQTKEHARLAQSLGITQMVVVVNKLDAFPQEPFSRARFDEIEGHVRPYLTSIGFDDARVSFVPVSAMRGDNLSAASPAPEELKAWYTGPSLLAAVDALQPPARRVSAPFRLVAADAYPGCVRGKVCAGAVAAGETVMLSPGAVPVKVQTITRNGETVQLALAGDDVELKVQCPDAALRPGAVLCELSVESSAAQVVPVVTRFEAQIIAEQARKKVPMLPGSIAVLHSAAFKGPVAVAKLVAQLDEHGSRVARPPRFVPSGATAIVEFTVLDQGLALLQPIGEFPEIARFSLRRDDETVAVGYVTAVLETARQIGTTQ